MKSSSTRPLRQSSAGVSSLLLALLLFSISLTALADGSARFDLLGPKIDIRVTRDGHTLPIAMVPNLKVGDRIFIHPDLPESQSVKLVMVVAFLRGTTNPPPDHWFTYVETWNKKVQAEGVSVTVPPEAQQALIFVAPETGGDFSTLRSAVRGRPGIFVRASQDLNEASYEQSRIEHFIEDIRRVPAGDAKALAEHSKKLADTLNLKPNDDCFKRPPDQQSTCLSQSGSQLLLDDGHGQTVASTLANGPSSDLIGAAASTPMAGAGLYSAYVGAVVDLVRILSGLHTAKFQYIPAIAFPKEETLNLRLNVPPSFHDPKSVIVIGLPAIQEAHLPPLRPQDPKHVSCLLQPDLVLPLDGAPLVFSTSYAHDLILHVSGVKPERDIPLKPDAFEGGLVAGNESDRKILPTPTDDSPGTTTSVPPSTEKTAKDNTPAPAGSLPPVDSNQVLGTVRGYWGFDPFEGPVVPLQDKPGTNWHVVAKPELIAGRDNHLLLQSTATACVSGIAATVPGVGSIPVDYKRADAPQSLDLRLPLQRSSAGDLSIQINQYGASPNKVDLTTYAEAVHLDSIHMHAGDRFAMLTGSSLADIKSVDIHGTVLTPTGSPVGDPPTLRLDFPKTPKAPDMKPGDHQTAQAALKDGRVLNVDIDVDTARPTVRLLSKDISTKGVNGLHLALADKDDIPLNSKLSLVLQSDSPTRFARTEKIEIATTDGSLHTTLTLADGTLILQDAQTVIGFLKPLDVFGQSAFGALQLRPVMQDGTVGDWVPLGNLVRTPVIQQISCGRTIARRTREPKADPKADLKADFKADSKVDSATPAPAASSSTSTQTSEAPPDQAPATQTPAPVTTTTVTHSRTCTLTGSNLFLLDSFSADGAFNNPTTVPLGFAGDTLEVPRPVDGTTLFLKLRDDPSTIASANISASPATNVTQ